MSENSSGGWQIDAAPIGMGFFGVETECSRADDASIDDGLLPIETSTSTRASIEFSMRELDHRLRISESAPHFIADVSSSTVNFLVEPNDAFGYEVDSFFQPIRGHVEVSAHRPP